MSRRRKQVSTSREIESDPESFQCPDELGVYDTPIGDRWYGVKREFKNEPIFLCPSLKHVGHIMPVLCFFDRPPPGVKTRENHLQWQNLWDRRCELEMFCRFHGCPIPIARSAELCTDKSRDEPRVIDQLQREIDQMQRRLDRYHEIEFYKREHVDPNRGIVEDILENEDLVSDCELSDYPYSSDDDFVKPLPKSLIVNGKPWCCIIHNNTTV